MKLARQLERRLEDALDHLAGRIFRGGLHLSELAARVAREAELAEYRTPSGPATANRYTLLVNPANLAEDPEPLARELEIAFADLAAERGWRLEGPVRVEVARSTEVGVGSVQSAASIEAGEIPCWAQLTDETGQRIPIRTNRARIGRSQDADVVIDQPEVSRIHALIYRQDGEIHLLDLGSSNGTKVDGTTVGASPVVVPTVAEITSGQPPLSLHPMPELILTILRLIFLALVYLFIWQVARAISRHLGFGQSGGRSSKRTAKQVAVVRSDSQAGLTFAVNGATVVGRSDQADVMIEDPYASEFHFRLGFDRRQPHRLRSRQHQRDLRQRQTDHHPHRPPPR